jgi:SAM-dependent methyltransferase
MNNVYKNPHYWEIAFSFRDIAEEVDLIEEAIAQFSDIPVSTVLDVGCGPAPHMREFSRREYRYIGLDLSPEMIAYAQLRAQEFNISARFEVADMTRFTLDEPVDLAIILLGSLQIRSAAELESHFDSLSQILKPGGIFFLDWCIEFNPKEHSKDSWEMEQGDIKVKTTFQTELINPAEQIYQETITLEVDDNNQKMLFEEVSLQRRLYPQEFLLYIASRSDFEFIGWWNNWDFDQPVEKTKQITRPIIILKRI